MLKVKELLAKEGCPQKAFFMNQNLNSYKNKNYNISILLKNLWSQDFLNIDTDNFIDTNLKEDIFFNKKEYEVELDLLKAQVKRFVDYLKTNNYSYLPSQSVYLDLNNGEKVKVSIDLTFEVDNGNTEKDIEVTFVKRRVPNLKYAGQKNDTKASFSIELYLLEEAGKVLYPGRNIIASIYYLKNSDDKKGVLTEFEFKKGKNKISTEHAVMSVNNIQDRINNLLEDGNKGKCESGDCDICEYNKLCTYKHIDYSTLKLIPPSNKASGVLFTPEQMRVINHEKGNVRVNAVAGSGKTTVLVNRVINLIRNGYRPQDFLLITFTEKGCIEIKEKLDYWLYNGNIQGVSSEEFNITTFNGYGYELIKKEYLNLGFSKEPKMIDKIEKLEIIDNIISSMPMIKGMNYTNPLMDFYNAKGVLIELSELIDFIKANAIVYPDDLAVAKNYDDMDKAEAIMTVYIKYRDELVKNGYIDYQDMINYTIKIFQDDNNIAKYGVRHIMVDEYQDSDDMQLYIIKKLSTFKHTTSLLICGDSSQAIYGFRGTSPKNILNFHLDFDYVKDIPLNENFRSTKEICSVADYIKDLNKNKINSRMISKKRGKTPSLGVYNPVEIIKDKIKNGIALNDICVIARTKAELLALNEGLNLEGIPSIVAVSESYIDNYNIKNIIGYAKFLLDNSLDLHFAEYLQIVKYDEYEANINNLKAFVEKEKEDFLNNFMNLPNEIEKIEFFFKSLESVSKRDRMVSKFLDLIKSKSFFMLNDLLNYLIKVEKYKSDGGTKDSNNYEAVILTTAHASKGREFDNVILLLSGFKKKNRNSEEIEEERRLLYVAISRAKEELIMTYEPNTYRYSFIDEVVEALLKVA